LKSLCVCEGAVVGQTLYQRIEAGTLLERRAFGRAIEINIEINF
jgi:hypothetical protein